jgi:hypothetical protein
MGDTNTVQLDTIRATALLHVLIMDLDFGADGELGITSKVALVNAGLVTAEQRVTKSIKQKIRAELQAQGIK